MVDGLPTWSFARCPRGVLEDWGRGIAQPSGGRVSSARRANARKPIDCSVHPASVTFRVVGVLKGDAVRIQAKQGSARRLYWTDEGFDKFCSPVRAERVNTPLPSSGYGNWSFSPRSGGTTVTTQRSRAEVQGKGLSPFSGGTRASTGAGGHPPHPVGFSPRSGGTRVSTFQPGVVDKSWPIVSVRVQAERG